MCDVSCIIYAIKNLKKEEVVGKRVIEVGSYDVNGSIRPYVESLTPSEYIGVDIQKGPGVDIVGDAHSLVNIFGKESFDIVISNEMLEHVKDWRKVVSNLKNICKKNGMIIITTRSFGFRYHAWPYDFWRYELDDMKKIFSDCEILSLEKDTFKPGVFLKVKMPDKFMENDLSDLNLYCMLTGRRTKNIEEKYLYGPHYRYVNLKYQLDMLIYKIWDFTFAHLP